MVYYLLIALMGLISGSLVNVYSDMSSVQRPVLCWYLGCFYKKTPYLAAQGILAGLYILLYKKYGISISFAGYAVMMALLLAAAIIDIKHRVIPNRLAAVGAAAGTVIAVINFDLPIVFDAFLGLFAAGGLLGIIHILSKGGIGMGDVKLFACAGIFLGLQQVLYSLVLAIIAGGAAGVILLITRVSGRKGTMPFAPFILVGCALTVLWL